MYKKALLSIVVTTYIGCISTAFASAPQPVFTPEQEARIGEVAADYLVAHPEILVKVSQKLQEQQQARQQLGFAMKVLENQQALLNDKDTPMSGPSDARVAVIEFFDYQCVYCSKLAPEMEKVMKARGDVRYIFKEWPIFASRWENSQKAAEKGLSVSDIDKAAADALAGHKTPLINDDAAAILLKTGNLAQALGLTGTPGLIVMPVNKATPDKITVLPGAVPAEQIIAAIDKASR